MKKNPKQTNTKKTTKKTNQPTKKKKQEKKGKKPHTAQKTTNRQIVHAPSPLGTEQTVINQCSRASKCIKRGRAGRVKPWGTWSRVQAYTLVSTTSPHPGAGSALVPCLVSHLPCPPTKGNGKKRLKKKKKVMKTSKTCT